MPKASAASPHPQGAGSAGAASLPRHVAIIMDGNGRWAKARGMSRARGHEEGAESVRKICEACVDIGIPELTLYAFSTENWSRPPYEVQALMRLLRRFLIAERAEMLENGIQLRGIGRLDDLPRAVRKELDKSVDLTRGNSKVILRLALSYGGRAEIIDATRRLAAAVAAGKLAAEDVTEEVFHRYLYDEEMSDPDLLIRTGGDQRVSNFLLWHISYTELYITPVCWPAFRREQFEEALRAFAGRRRRFGGIPEAHGVATGGVAVHSA